MISTDEGSDRYGQEPMARTERRDTQTGPLAIVGIGASAGGLKAITALLGAVPTASRLAFVVIQHRIPNNERLLSDLLAKATPLSVQTAHDGILLEADHIYIAPAGLLPTMEAGQLRIREPKMSADASLPIDIFFRTLATDQHEKAICVVLSGTGADGTNGLRSIKECGGLVVVQDPTTAEFDGMPNSAIATGMADYILAPERMPGVIVDFVHQPYLGPVALQSVEAPDDALDGILDLLNVQTKRDHRAYKPRSLSRRIERRMGIHHIGDMSEYRAFLGTHPAEIELLSRDILISVTRFFRDGPAFEALADDFIAPLVRSRPAGKPIRVWVPACATGEEAYSIAILLLEACAQNGSSPDFRVFATDVDSRALTIARTGLYPETITVDVSAERLDRFFTKAEGGYKVAKPLRDAVSFAQHDLLSNPPFSKLDLISCRNMLIYIEPDVQKAIFALFHFALVENGGLLLGTAETIDARSDLFRPLSKKWRLYRKVGTTRGSAMSVPSTGGRSAITLPAPPAPLRGNSPADLIRQALLLEYAPAAVLIDGQHRVQYLFGPTGEFLDLPTGEPPWDLTAMTRGELRLQLRRAVAQALASHGRVQISGIRHKRQGVMVPVTILVIPVRFPRAGNELLLVTFTAGDAAPSIPTGEAPVLPAAMDSVEQLESELRMTREELNETIGELSATSEALRVANEEILSIGEEYQSTTEELETSKEELQSLNEELSTLNTQLHEKVDELEATTNDLGNLLSSTDIATVFLSSDLRIKRFTPPATRMFALLPQDTGRPITDIARHFSDPCLLTDIRSVLSSMTPSEREVSMDGDTTYLRRIQPYRTQHAQVEGVVITFSDVTPLKRTSLAMALRARQYKLIADLGRKDPVGADGPETLAEAAHLIAEGLGVDGVAILGPGDDPSGRRTGDADDLVLLGSVGFSVPQDPAVRISTDMATLVGRVFRSRQPLIVEDFATDQRVRSPLALPGGPAVSGLGVPFGDGTRGPSVLAVLSQTAGRFGDADLEFVQAIASVLGLVIERAGVLRAARAERDFAQAIVDTVREPLLVLDETLRVVGASAAFHHIFATTPEDVQGARLAEMAGGLLADPGLRRALERIIPNGTVIEALELTVGRDTDNQEAGGQDADGRNLTRRTLLLNARRLNQAGRLILLAMEDVTEQVRVRQALAAAKAAAEQASASKTRFLAAASHDLRQPVQALIMFHHLVTMQPQGEAAAKLLASMGNALGAMTVMLDDILDVSRLDAGIIQVMLRSCSIQTMIASLCAEFSPLAEAAGLELRCIPTNLAVRSDPKLLERILRNFIANAIKYTDKGGILVGCRRAGTNLRIQVWDTGRGIPPNQLASIFEEFHQVDNPERDRRQGLGLGLAIVERLATLLQHPIRVRSTPGRGSMFEILVPLASQNDPVPKDEETPIPNGGNGERVAVVDDDPAVLDGVTAFLQEQGYEVVAAPDGDTAVKRLANQAPDLVIADFRLKGTENGSEVISRLARHFAVQLPGILLTGDTSPARIREASASGFLLLHKPLSPDPLLTAIRCALADQPSTRTGS
ncbi:response regulator [Azospirillum sp. Sh1]|nr:response regulator [Azospirillum sp. Sh1]